MVEYPTGTMPGARPACSPFTLMHFGVQLLLVPQPTLAAHLGYRCLAVQPVHAGSLCFFPRTCYVYYWQYDEQHCRALHALIVGTSACAGSGSTRFQRTAQYDEQHCRA